MKNSKSVVFKRQQALLKLLKERKTIDVDTASQKLAVSPTTIRRDLDMFEQQHLVERFHGGAKLLEGTLHEEDTTSKDRAFVDREQKEAIARYAAELISDGDTIFMNSSFTASLMVDDLKVRHGIVVTNNAGVID